MYPGMLDLISQRDLLPSVNWEIVIDSSVVGLSKPQDEIYILAAKEASVDPVSILFVENTNISRQLITVVGRHYCTTPQI